MLVYLNFFLNRRFIQFSVFLYFILFYRLKFITVSDILNDMSDPVASAQALGIATTIVNSVTCANAGKVIYCIAVIVMMILDSTLNDGSDNFIIKKTYIILHFMSKYLINLVQFGSYHR